MKTFGITIAVGLGDAIFIAAALNSIKHNYDQININVRWDLAETYKNNGVEYSKFYLEILKLLFNDPKFIIDDRSKTFPFISTESFFNSGFVPVLPRFFNVLQSNNVNPIDGDYIVITTKVRQLALNSYVVIKNQLTNCLNALSKKYKIVILGERVVEMNTEYKHYGGEYIYNIYNDVVKINNIVDLSIPKLGITVPEIECLKKDCSIMNGAKCVITLGCGGNFVLAAAVSNRLVGYRYDDYSFVNRAFAGQNNLVLVDNGSSFIELLKKL